MNTVSETQMGLSDEQFAVTVSNASSIKVNACAGSGKSRTLIGVAERRINTSMLCLSFNKSIQEEAKSKFGSNVTCMTNNGLAYEAIGKSYDEAGKVGDTRVMDIANAMGVDHIQAYMIKKTVDRFLGSADDSVGVSHVDQLLAKQSGADSDGDIQWVVEKSAALWEMMQDPTEARIMLPHDGYLKMYVQSGVDLSEDYGTIMMDEAQDTTAAMAKFFMEQKCQRILVGDTNQSINAWRGAINAMEKFECDETYELTNSFRYGQWIAQVGNAILKSKGQPGGVKGLGSGTSRGEVPAVICRTNTSVLNACIALGASGKRVHLVGGVESYRFKKILEVCELAFGDKSKVTDVFYKNFESMDALEEFARLSNDVETMQICKMVTKFGRKTARMVDMATRHMVTDASKANITLGTAHRVKGLEFDVVGLEDDFLNIATVKPGDLRNVEEEKNLLYVACTRARCKLNPSKSLNNWLLASGMM